jgi:formylglycine-generating enzyme required for sulfatase activity
LNDFHSFTSVVDAREDVQIEEKVSAGFALGIMGDPRDLDAMIPIELVRKTNSRGSKYSIYVGKYPITNALFHQFVESGYVDPQFWSDAGWIWKEAKQIEAPAYWNDSQFNQPNQPVVGISWYEAEAFANFRGMRLLSATEWEQIVKGDENLEYPWGIDYISGYANTSDIEIGGTCAVGLFPQGAIHGIYDLAGQVWEWTSTNLDESRFILKGGSWAAKPEHAQASYQFRLHPEVRDSFNGFRLALDQET